MDKVQQVRSFQRWTHRIYHRSSGLSVFFSRRVKPAGILLILMFPAVWMVMPLHTHGPLYQLRGLIFVILTLAFIWVTLRNAQLSATRETPRIATAGQPLTYRINICNDGKKSIHGASIIELSPDSRPSPETFAHSTEPGEHTRNLFDQKFAYYRWKWLQHTLTLLTQDTPAKLPSLRPGGQTTLSITITPQRRGIIALQDLRVCLPDPFGVFQRCRKIKTLPHKIIVLPKRYKLPTIETSGGAQHEIGTHAIARGMGQTGDFTAVREYRPGDPLRSIHWKSWAKTGKPIVKEYEDLISPRCGILLDTFAPEQNADLFEEALSVTASFVSNIDTHHSLLDILFIKDKAFTCSSSDSQQRADTILETLAGLNTEAHSDFKSLQKNIFRYSNNLTACICIFVGWCEQRQQTVNRLHSAGITLTVISICRDLDSAKVQLKKHPSPVPISLLRINHIQADILKLGPA